MVCKTFYGVCQIVSTQVQERLDMLNIEKVDLPVRYHRARIEAGFDPETYSWQELLYTLEFRRGLGLQMHSTKHCC